MIVVSMPLNLRRPWYELYDEFGGLLGQVGDLHAVDRFVRRRGDHPCFLLVRFVVGDWCEDRSFSIERFELVLGDDDTVGYYPVRHIPPRDREPDGSTSFAPELDPVVVGPEPVGPHLVCNRRRRCWLACWPGGCRSRDWRPRWRRFCGGGGEVMRGEPMNDPSDLPTELRDAGPRPAVATTASEPPAVEKPPANGSRARVRMPRRKRQEIPGVDEDRG